MDGPKGVVDHLVGRLTDTLPSKLAELRARYTLAVHDVPDPVAILGWEPETEGLDQLPAVYVIEQSTTLHTIDKDPGGGTVWQTDTPCHVMGIVSGTDYQSTARARQQYTLAIREVLLQRPLLGDNYRIVTDQYSEAHGEVARGDTSIVHGVRVTIIVRAEELLNPYVPILGQVGASGVLLRSALLRFDTPTIPPTP